MAASVLHTFSVASVSSMALTHRRSRLGNLSSSASGAAYRETLHVRLLRVTDPPELCTLRSACCRSFELRIVKAVFLLFPTPGCLM